MKKTITKIWSVGLALMLLVSLLAFAAPQTARAAPGPMTFTTQSAPTSTSGVLRSGSDITDFAVANDGATIFVIDGNVSANTTGSVIKSTNGGQSFANVASAPSGAGGNPLRAIAVAPDDPGAIAVIEAASGANLVHISNNGGTTWSTLPGFVSPSAAADAMDIAVGPVRAGTLLSREYAVALADSVTDNTAAGDVQIIGSSTTWRSAGRNTGIAGDADFMAVAFDPNFVGTRVLITVAASESGDIGAGVSLYLVNDSTGLEVTGETVLEATAQDYQTTGTDATDILSADIALPSDYDPTTASGRRAYVVTAHAATTNDDVFRVDNANVRALGATNRDYKSVSYSGTIDEGTLFTGDYSATTVRFTTNPQVSLPTWTSTKKAPTGTILTVVRVASDFATSSRVFAGTTDGGAGGQSAFSVSNNAAISFDQESLIDLDSANDTVEAIQSIELTPDGNTIFMATDNGALLSLWKSATPVSPTSWSRIRTMTGATGLVRVNPDWASSPVVYFADLDSGGAIHRSSNGGDIFAVRAAPSGVTPSDIAVQDANVIYLGASGSANVYKSTTGAWTWGLPKSTQAGATISLAVAKADHLIVGKAGAIAWSTDGISTFKRVATGYGGGDAIVLADDDYENNNTIYAGSATTGLVYRFIIGESSVWSSLGNDSAAAIVGLAMQGGALYVASAAAIDVVLNPRAATGTVDASWDIMTTGSPQVTAENFAVAPGGSNAVYSANATLLQAWNDSFSMASPVLTAPGDGATVGIDPVSGRADLVTLGWEAYGSGAASADTVDIWITEKGQGWGAATRTNLAVTASAPHARLGSGAQVDRALLSNTEYEWRVRWADSVSNAGMRSQWSDVFTIKVQSGTVVQQPHAGPVILGPQGGSTTSLTPGISWAPFAGATKYQVILATDAGLKNRVAGTPVFVESPAWQPAEALDYGTTYFFAITAVEPTVSPQAIGTFITMAKAPPPPPKPAPPVVVKEVPAPIINIPAAPAPPAQIAPAYIWAIIIIGAILIIALIVLMFRTRRPM